MKKIRILFVCRHNMFRSRIAEIYFKKINRNKNVVVTSAGLIRGYLPLKKGAVAVAREFDINLKGKPCGISIDLIKRQYMIIIVANDVPRSMFNNNDYVTPEKKIIEWKIPDDIGSKNPGKMRRIIRAIMKKVDKLNRQLEKKK